MGEATGINELRSFLKHALPGERFCYATATSLMESLLTRNIQKETYRLATQGRLYLVQKRVSKATGLFDYYAVKASKTPMVRLIPYSEEKINELQGFTKCQEPV